MSSVYCALVHHPVRDREGAVVTTAVTNLDVHDIARAAKTYGLAGYFVVTPIEAQHRLVDRIVGHWREGAGARRIPARGQALALVRTVDDVEAACSEIAAREGRRPRLIATAARTPAGIDAAGFAEESRTIRSSGDPVLILFGTGHGLVDEVLASADALLEPIAGPSDYNHLSVRAAVAIVLDRLFGRPAD